MHCPTCGFTYLRQFGGVDLAPVTGHCGKPTAVALTYKLIKGDDES